MKFTKDYITETLIMAESCGCMPWTVPSSSIWKLEIRDLHGVIVNNVERNRCYIERAINDHPNALRELQYVNERITELENHCLDLAYCEMRDRLQAKDVRISALQQQHDELIGETGVEITTLRSEVARLSQLIKKVPHVSIGGHPTDASSFNHFARTCKERGGRCIFEEKAI